LIGEFITKEEKIKASRPTSTHGRMIRTQVGPKAEVYKPGSESAKNLFGCLSTLKNMSLS
jgi:hypothetical protein